jgi:putative membrane protein
MSSLPLSALPALNAALNATCAVLLVSGYLMIRRRKVLAHKICMGSAFAVAVIVLASYLTYQVGSMSFGGQGWMRPDYAT